MPLARSLRVRDNFAAHCTRNEDGVDLQNGVRAFSFRPPSQTQLTRDSPLSLTWDVSGLMQTSVAPMAHVSRFAKQRRSQGSGRLYFFQIRVSRDHLHITIYLTMVKIADCVCSPNSIIIKNNIIFTS